MSLILHVLKNISGWFPPGTLLLKTHEQARTVFSGHFTIVNRYAYRKDTILYFLMWGVETVKGEI